MSPSSTSSPLLLLLTLSSLLVIILFTSSLPNIQAAAAPSEASLDNYEVDIPDDATERYVSLQHWEIDDDLTTKDSVQENTDPEEPKAASITTTESQGAIDSGCIADCEDYRYCLAYYGWLCYEPYWCDCSTNGGPSDD